jgi:hypothetical protein
LAVVSFLHSASTSGCLPVSEHPNARQRKPLPAFTSLRFLWTRHHPPPLALLAPVRQGVLIREQARKRQSHVCFRARARGIRPAASAASFLSHVNQIEGKHHDTPCVNACMAPLFFWGPCVCWRALYRYDSSEPSALMHFDVSHTVFMQVAKGTSRRTSRCLRAGLFYCSFFCLFCSCMDQQTTCGFKKCRQDLKLATSTIRISLYTANIIFEVAIRGNAISRTLLQITSDPPKVRIPNKP